MSEPIGILLILSGPSGSGKTTLCRQAEATEGFTHSISATTRAPRPGETNGIDYHFLSPEEFQDKIAQDAFLEHAQVHGNHYGTLKTEILPRISQGQHVVMDIDIQGARQVRSCPEPLIDPAMVDVFISPANRSELQKRLAGRGTDSQEVIAQRLENALQECAAWAEYRFAIPSTSKEQDWQSLRAIIHAAKLRTYRQRFDFLGEA